MNHDEAGQMTVNTTAVTAVNAKQPRSVFQSVSIGKPVNNCFLMNIKEGIKFLLQIAFSESQTMLFLPT